MGGSKKKTKVATVEVMVSVPPVATVTPIPSPEIVKRRVPDQPNRAQVQAVKIATLTEIVWYGDKVAPEAEVLEFVRKLLVAVDWPDSWWRKKVNTSIGEWLKFLRYEFENTRMQMERREYPVETNAPNDDEEEV